MLKIRNLGWRGLGIGKRSNITSSNFGLEVKSFSTVFFFDCGFDFFVGRVGDLILVDLISLFIIIIILPIEKHMQSKIMVLYPPCY